MLITPNSIYLLLLILIFLIISLIFQMFRFRKRLNLIFRKGRENIEDVLKNLLWDLDRQKKETERILKELSSLKDISRISFQKFSVERYNPFKDSGGNQSFSIALLDQNNSGVVITSIYSREGNRVYAKPINNGKSEYPLADEEKMAIKKATDSTVNSKSQTINLRAL